MISRWIGICLITTTLWGCSPEQSNQETAHGISADRLARIDTVLQEMIDQKALPGAVVMIHKDGKQVYAKAFGWQDREAGEKMQMDTIFRIASQTKAITSVAVMMLIEEGKLLLNDPLGKHLPEWHETNVAQENKDGSYDIVPAKRPITVRDLLAHTSGISYGGDGTGIAAEIWKKADFLNWYFADDTEPMASQVARMAKLPMTAHPGEKFIYGYNTDILGALIEKVSGMSLEQFFQKRIFTPLGMVDTTFCLPAEKSERLAVVYSKKGAMAERAPSPGAHQGPIHVGQGHYENGPCKAHSGGAGLLSTVSDYARFLEMLRQGGTYDGHFYLGRKSIELMTADQLTNRNIQAFGSNGSFGLGFRIVTGPDASGSYSSVGEYAWGGAYHTQYWVDPKEKLSVVYMTQVLPASGLDDYGKIRALIYQALN